MSWSAITSSGGVYAETTELYAIVQAAAHPDSKKLLAFWEARSEDGIVMGRDVPSRAIAPLLSHIAVWEPVDEGRNMKIRLAGEAMHRRFPGDLRGLLMSELFASNFADHLGNARRVLETGLPLILDARMSYGNIEKLHLEVVLLPVVAPARNGLWVLTGGFYFD